MSAYERNSEIGEYMFKFELESVRSLKEKLEDSKKRELGIANSKKEQLVNQKQLLLERQQNVFKEKQVSNMEKIDLQAMKILNNYALHIDKEIKHKENEITTAKKVVKQKQGELLEAMKERKILDNLKAIKREQHRVEEGRKEQQIIDEVVSYKYGAVKRSED